MAWQTHGKKPSPPASRGAHPTVGFRLGRQGYFAICPLMTSQDAGDQRLGAGGIETDSFEGKGPEMRSLPIVGYGVNGDPLRQGKLDLPELLETPTPDECDWARKFIARRR